jgi:hypothetical protein
MENISELTKCKIKTILYDSHRTLKCKMYEKSKYSQQSARLEMCQLGLHASDLVTYSRITLKRTTLEEAPVSSV